MREAKVIESIKKDIFGIYQTIETETGKKSGEVSRQNKMMLTWPSFSTRVVALHRCIDLAFYTYSSDFYYEPQHSYG
jgi:hypothetical protein